MRDLYDEIRVHAKAITRVADRTELNHMEVSRLRRLLRVHAWALMGVALVAIWGVLT